MKAIYLISLFFFQLSAFCSYNYQYLVKNDGELIQGELIAQYDEQWFWESAYRNQYRALFYLENQEPVIRMINENEIIYAFSYFRKDSTYQSFLTGNGLNLQGAPLENWNTVSTGNDGHHLKENMYGNFAWDLVIENNGRTYQDDGKEIEDFFTFGTKIYSPVSGVIVDIDNDEVDHAPDLSLASDLSQRGDGNYILIHLMDNFYFSMLHLKKGSISLKLGDYIQAGEEIGKVGNSGITYVPHLHMTLYYYSTTLGRMVSIPTYFNGIDKSAQCNLDHYIPRTGDRISTASSNCQ